MSHRTGEGMPRAGDEATVPAKGAPVLIIGGAGFIGTNLAHRLLQNGYRVRIYDNLSRRGTEHNLRWLADAHSSSSQSKLDIHNADLRDRPALRLAIGDAGVVFHLAAQVAVTASLDDPESDFAINAAGTLGLLEELRALTAPPPLVFTSTNKVYGSLEHIELIEEGSRYQPIDPDVRAHGVSEATPLCFRSPYGCSKGAADQYVLDYAATFALPAAVFRMSCIYGPHQHGTEEQGWIAHFVRSALAGYGVTIYGDGKQVRDVLFVDDLVNALLMAWQHIRTLAGQAFNIGGGPERALSVLDLITLIRAVTGADTPIQWAPWRPADQRYFVSDIRGFRHATGWSPNVDIARGVALLGGWLASQACPHGSPSHGSGAPARGRALTTTDIATSNT